MAKRHGWSLDGISIFELVPPEAALDPEKELTLFHPAELELSETSKLIFDRVTETQSHSRCVRQPLRDAPAGTEFTALSPTDTGVETLLRGRHCTVLLPRRPVVK